MVCVCVCVMQAAFYFNFLPFSIPYPVPFRILGDERKVRYYLVRSPAWQYIVPQHLYMHEPLT